MNIFVLNAGSSSLKYRLYRMEDHMVLAEGGCERIGIDGRIKYKNHAGFSVREDVSFPDHETAFRKVLAYLTEGDGAVISDLSEINAIGHRVVHGGVRLVHPTRITPRHHPGGRGQPRLRAAALDGPGRRYAAVPEAVPGIHL